MLARLVVIALCLSLMVPGVSAQSSGVRVRVVPQYEEVALEPGVKGGVDLDVNFEVRTTCTTGTHFGVSLVFGSSFPSWAGASPEPGNLQFDHDGGKEKARLEIFPSEDAPAGESVTYKIRPEVHLPPSSNCTGTLNVDSMEAPVTLTIVGPESDSPTPSTRAGNGSPGLGFGSVVLLLLGAAFLRRRA